MDLVNREALVRLCRKWADAAREADRLMQSLRGPTLSNEGRKRYRALHAKSTALRGCANDLADLLGIEREN
jgi:hypothetical protein